MPKEDAAPAPQDKGAVHSADIESMQWHIANQPRVQLAAGGLYDQRHLQPVLRQFRKDRQSEWSGSA